MKIARIIDDAAVPQVFNEARIADLACILKLPSGSDLERFGEIVLSGVRNFVEKAVQPTPNALAGEIRNLRQFASGKNFPALASAFEAMTPALRELLAKRTEQIEGHFCSSAAYRVARGRLARDERSAWVADQMTGWRLPSAADLRKVATRSRAADALVALLEWGGEYRLGRRRPSGRRSRTWHPYLHGPLPSRAEPRREAERQFVMFLQFDLARVGVRVPTSADPRKPGPFARMVGECLVLTGAAGPANARGLAVQIINDLQKERAAAIREQDAG